MVKAGHNKEEYRELRFRESCEDSLVSVVLCGYVCRGVLGNKDVSNDFYHHIWVYIANEVIRGKLSS